MPSSSAVQSLFSVKSAAFTCIFLLLSPALASESDHKYQAHEKVTLWTKAIGPYNNPQKTYNYYSLPFCSHVENNVEWDDFGEVLGGNNLIYSLIDMKFLKNVDRSVICQLELDEANANHFKYAIENKYWFELLIDDLPMWGFVGNIENNKHVLYTHKNIIVKYNKDQIIHVNLTQESPMPLEVGKTMDLTYSVKWIQTNVTFARRFDIYVGYSFFKYQFHWFSIFHMFMMLIFLIGLVSMILIKTLRCDYTKYARDNDNDVERRLVVSSLQPHGPSRNLVLLSAAVGTSAQLGFLVLLVMLVTIIGTLYVGYVLHSSYDQLLMD